ncbi:uncharacterized protein MEPE_00973 [Melanopsichium pennsylvanicum]|uniref:SUZ domain-containing protein n=2 Tax=Melanopsichium pennsylvanicum TaxID=63383 RepID=A0AAJ4XH87_9BASI|nr:uncharacterized protein MEPE_00973 [Melanopsichium pennsylvanicum]
MSSATIQDDGVVVTSKFKPSKPNETARQRQQETEVVDDWDVESSTDESDTTTSNAKDKDVFRPSKDQWTEANSQAPAPVPIVAPNHARSLPGAAFGHRLEVVGIRRNRNSPTSITNYHGGVTIATAPPRILQRPKEAAPGMRSDGTSLNASIAASQERKTVEQRQEEYRLARARIFGPSNKASTIREDSSRRQPRSRP